MAKNLAESFALISGSAVEEWMLWDGWQLWVGCNACLRHGAKSSCWGRAACHGFFRACGCRECAKLGTTEWQ